MRNATHTSNTLPQTLMHHKDLVHHHTRLPIATLLPDPPKQLENMPPDSSCPTVPVPPHVLLHHHFPKLTKDINTTPPPPPLPLPSLTTILRLNPPSHQETKAPRPGVHPSNVPQTERWTASVILDAKTCQRMRNIKHSHERLMVSSPRPRTERAASTAEEGASGELVFKTCSFPPPESLLPPLPPPPAQSIVQEV